MRGLVATFVLAVTTKASIAATEDGQSLGAADDLCTSNHGINCVGDDMPNGNISNITTHLDCCALCGQHPGCNAWTWHWTSKDCYLKSACSERQTSSDDYHSSPTPSPSPAPSPTPPPPSPSPGYHQCPILIKLDGETLNLNVAALTPGLVTSSNGESITMTYGEQTRAFVVKDSINDMPVFNYFNFTLLGKELSYDIDLSTVGCSCNAALFFVSMPGYNQDGTLAHGSYNPYYCDGNDVGGVWCWEHDAIESNKYTMATTPHKCSAPPGGYIASCDGIGCSTNAFNADPNGMCPDTRCKIDTRKPFRIHQKHVMDSITKKLSQIINTLVQGTNTFEWIVCTKDPSYVEQMTEAFRDMKMVFQLWGTNHGRMSWLDSMTGCSGDCNTASAAVTFSNIEISSLSSDLSAIVF